MEAELEALMKLIASRYRGRLSATICFPPRGTLSKNCREKLISKMPEQKLNPSASLNREHTTLKGQSNHES